MNSKKTYTFEEAKIRLARYCAYQERSHQEVEQKLYKMGMIREACEQIILYLLQHDFLNEERFAKAFVSGKFRIKKWGRLKIRQALQQKGVSAANIAIGLAEIDEVVYLEVLGGLRQAQSDKLRQAQSDPSTALRVNSTALRVNSTTLRVNPSKKMTYKDAQKVIRYLQQKGFELELIYESIKR